MLFGTHRETLLAVFVLTRGIRVSDAVHTVLVCASIWLYTISNFNNPGIEAHIFPSVAVSCVRLRRTANPTLIFYQRIQVNVSLTAFITFIVNAYVTSLVSPDGHHTDASLVSTGGGYTKAR